MFSPIAALLLFQFPFQAHVLYRNEKSELRGAAVVSANDSVLAWGDALHRVPLRGGSPRVAAAGWFGEGGCLTDVDGDGREDLVTQAGRGLGHLVWLRAPDWKRYEIDSEVEMHDCLPATLFGRRGILMVQRYQQVRFYEYPGTPRAEWPYREIYSIYTASRQGGLALADVNGDGRVDIFCGNYWIRSPEQFELPWRLFAINVWHQEPGAATMRFALDGPDLIVSQGEMGRGRVARFRKPPDPEEQWPVEILDGLAFPHGLTRADFDGDGRPDMAAGENNGASSRLVLLTARGRLETPAGGGIHTLLVRDVNGDGRPDLIAAGPHSVVWWENHFRK